MLVLPTERRAISGSEYTERVAPFRIITPEDQNAWNLIGHDFQHLTEVGMIKKSFHEVLQSPDAYLAELEEKVEIYQPISNNLELISCGDVKHLKPFLVQYASAVIDSAYFLRAFLNSDYATEYEMLNKMEKRSFPLQPLVRGYLCDYSGENIHVDGSQFPIIFNLLVNIRRHGRVMRKDPITLGLVGFDQAKRALTTFNYSVGPLPDLMDLDAQYWSGQHGLYISSLYAAINGLTLTPDVKKLPEPEGDKEYEIRFTLR